jgi:hypothetical protein
MGLRIPPELEAKILAASTPPVRIALPIDLTLPHDCSEEKFQAKVIELARSLGYLAFHTHDSRRSEPGFLDLVLCSPRKTLFVECKDEDGETTEEQDVWMDRLEASGQTVCLWRPSMIQDVKRILEEYR